VITYDEHGGCYDHVAPPGHATPPDPDSPVGQDGFTFNRFGVRVPTVVVSPWIEPGTVCRAEGWTPFDHTSILATVRNCFGLTEWLTERDKAAPDLGCCLTRTAPRTDRPKVKAPTIPSHEPPASNDLNQLICRLMESWAGKGRPPDKDTVKFVLETYTKFFSRKR
jgi:phospholipase C